MPPCGGAVLEGAEQEAELHLRLLRAQPDQIEDLLLHVRSVDTDGAATDLAAVADEVVAGRMQFPGSVSSSPSWPGFGAVKGWCSATHRFEASSSSNIRKSTTQTNFHAS